MLNFPASRVLSILILLIAIPMDAAGDLSQARTWLAESERRGAALPLGGVYAQFMAVRLDLTQALAHAMLGDVDATIARLPYSDADSERRPEWLSGGDGMVRQLLIGLDLADINSELAYALVDKGRFNDAMALPALLGENVGARDLYSTLGYLMGNPRDLPVKVMSSLTPPEQARFRLGGVRKEIEAGNTKAALRAYRKIDAAERQTVLQEYARSLMFAGSFEALARLYAVAGQAGDLEPMLLFEALSFAVRAGDMETAEQIIELTGGNAGEALYAQAAMGFAAAGQIDHARKIFGDVKNKTSRTWEQVAMMTGEDDWREQYYLAINDDWRRAERLYQFARSSFAEGRIQQADRLATQALLAAEKIESVSTRALALRMLAEYHAETGAPEQAVMMVSAIETLDADERELAQAQLQLSRAYAIAGDESHAVQTATDIRDAKYRVDAYVALLAIFSHQAPGNRTTYGNVVDRARLDCQSISTDRNEACVPLVKAQLSAGDISGARETAGQAGQATSWEALIEYLIEQRSYADAIATSQVLEPLRRDKALAQVIASLTANGDPDQALGLMSRIENTNVRDMQTPAIARSFVAAGKIASATRLMGEIQRDDSRGDAMSVVLYALAERGELASPSLLQYVPARTGASLCWSVAAAATQSVAATGNWLRDIREPTCAAFAYSGAAYALIAPADKRTVRHVFAAIDPIRSSERLTEAMQQQSIRGR